MFKKIWNYIINDLKKISSFDQHKVEVKGILKMGKTGLIAKNKEGLKHWKSPANHEAFQAKAKALGADFDMQRRNYNVWMVRAYIGFLGFFMAVFLVAFQLSILTMMTGLGAMAIMAGIWFSGSVRAFLIQHQQLDGILDWVKTPTEWLPDPKFNPQIKS